MKKFLDLTELEYLKAMEIFNTKLPMLWAKYNLSDKDISNGCYIFSVCTPDNNYGIVFIGEYGSKFFISSVGLNSIEGVEISDFKNGYFELFKDGKFDNLVVPGMKETGLYEEDMKPYFDKVYNNPAEIRNIPQNILLEDDNLEGFKQIAEFSFSDKQKEFNEIFDNIEKNRDKDLREK